MIFQVDTAFAVELLALAAGAGLVVYGLRQAEGKALAKVVGLLVMAGAIAAGACTGYYSTLYREAGHFEVKAAAPAGEHGGMKCPMMEKMEKMKEMQDTKEGGGEEDHGAHH